MDISQSLVSERKSNDMILYDMERGRYAQVVGNGEVSMADFTAAMEKIAENDQKALVSASGIGAQIGATLVNDNAIPYEGEGYERVLLHQYQALNYLKKKDISGAGVEARRAGFEQDEALKRFEKEVDKAREQAGQKRLDGSLARVEQSYAQMDEVAGQEKNSYQNAATFYLSGFINELLQQPNDAYIDYKKALEIFPENRYVQKDVFRLASRLEMGEDLAELKRRFSVDSPQFADPKGGGELLVIFEDGNAPHKRETKIGLLLGKAGLVTVAFPMYNEKRSSPLALRVLNGADLLGSTEMICDVRALAVKALQEKAPTIAVRQVLRTIGKVAAAAQMKKQAGELGQLAGLVWNYVSESADLRSWLTLPADVQIFRIKLPAGKYQLALQHPMAAHSVNTEVTIGDGGKSMIQVVRVGAELYRSVMQF